MSSDLKHSSLWWAASYKGRDDHVIDPDGWDRSNFVSSIMEPVTEEQYIKRREHSSTLGEPGGSNFEGFYQDVLEFLREKYPTFKESEGTPVDKVACVESFLKDHPVTLNI